MAKRRGLFGTTATTGNAATDVLKNINEMAKGSTSTQANAIKPSRYTPEQALQNKENAAYAREYRQLQTALIGGYNPFIKSEQEIASDPTLSSLKSGATYEQALADYQKLMSAQSLMPGPDPGLSDGQARFQWSQAMDKYRQAMSGLTDSQKNSEQLFLSLGGTVSVGDKPYVAMNAQDILKTWASLGDINKGKEIISSVFGFIDEAAGQINSSVSTSNPLGVQGYIVPTVGGETLSLTPAPTPKKTKTKTPSSGLTPAQREKLRLAAIPKGK